MNQIDGQQVHVEVPKTFASVGASVGVAPTTVRKIPLYACGGCGINVGAMIANMQRTIKADDRTHHAVAEVHYIDGSTQNYGSIPVADQKDNTYVMRRRDASVDLLHNPDGEELSGGGGDRAFMAAIAAKEAESVLSRWPASDEMNVVAMSAAGSVGATMGAHIFKQILAQGKPVVVILVSVNASSLRASNSAKTWMTLMQFQHNSNTSAGVFHAVNSGASRNAEIKTDDAIMAFWLNFSNVLAGTAQRLDARDIKNWLHFNQVFKTDAQLLLVDAYTTAASMQKADHDFVSAIGIQREDLTDTAAADTVLGKVLYNKVGVISSTTPPFNEAYLTARPLSADLLRDVDNNLTNAQSAVVAATQAQQQRNALINRFTAEDNDGLGVL